MESENFSDDMNFWGAFNDFVEWSLEPGAPWILVMVLLLERLAHQWIVRNAKRHSAADHSHE